MRETLVVAAVLLGTAALTATNGGSERPAASAPLEAQEARAFAEHLIDVVGHVARDYVRPISPGQLLFAALSGLYEAANLPVPDHLQADVDAALSQPTAKKDGASEVPDAETRQVDQRVFRFVAETRQQIGDCDSLRGQAALRVAVKALTRVLDPYSMLVDGKELRRSNGETVNQGLGLELSTEDVAGPLRIKSVIVGGPAQRAGIKPGDRITHVNGLRVTDERRALLALQLSGPQRDDRPTSPPERDGMREGQKVEVKVFPDNGGPPRHVTLEHRFFRPELVHGVCRDSDDQWVFLLDRERKIGYVRLGFLERGSADQLQEAVTRLQSEQVRGLILDLRWSPGGFLNEAVLILRLFLKEGLIATVRCRNSNDDQAYSAEGNNPSASDLPMIVLVNGETSGGAEMIAAALQDHQRARIAGQRSFGKASVQTLLPLQLQDLGLRLTTGAFVRPSGKTLHRSPDSQPSDDWGVRPEPELAMPVSPDLVKQLRTWYTAQALRPGACTEAVPVDDPENDPQRQAALRALRDTLKKR